MGTCEMCGEAGDLKKTKVEDATLKLCDGCRDVGEVVEQPQTSRTQQRSSSPSAPQEEVLPGYGETIKSARESREMSVADLAEALKEKESVVRRVESGKLTPDRGLARKFERELDVEIYGAPPEEPETTADSGSGEQTLGDVAEVRKG